MRILIVNGPNLNLLGKREPEIYGHLPFEQYVATLTKKYPQIHLVYYQSNHEGSIIDKIHEVGFEWQGIILNAGAYTHTSIAIADAIKAIKTPVVEVHISNIYQRESFRKQNFLKVECISSIIGKGLAGYDEAIEVLIEYYKDHPEN